MSAIDDRFPQKFEQKMCSVGIKYVIHRCVDFQCFMFKIVVTKMCFK